MSVFDITVSINEYKKSKNNMVETGIQSSVPLSIINFSLYFTSYHLLKFSFIGNKQKKIEIRFLPPRIVDYETLSEIKRKFRRKNTQRKIILSLFYFFGIKINNLCNS